MCSVLTRLIAAAITIGGLLLVWVTRELTDRTGHDLREFDPQEVAALEAEMLRAYYMRNRTAVFLELRRMLRQYQLLCLERGVAAYYAKSASVSKGS